MGNHVSIIDEYAQTIFEYEHVDDKLESADGIIAFGNHDTHVAERAAKLYLSGLAEYVLFAGGFGRITKSLWNQPEAERFADIALGLGVPEDAIVVEPRSSNTGENITLSRALLADRGLSASKLIAVDRPYRGRRTKAALLAQWPDAHFLIASPEMSYADYCKWYDGDGPIAKSDFISLLVGDLQRIKVYGEKGFQEKQVVPDEVEVAYEHLVDLGFTSQMISE